MQKYQQNMKKIKTGIASFGMSGRVFHAPFIAHNPGYDLVKIVERTPRGAQMIYPDVGVVNSYEELLDDRETELIIVNTPDATHYPLTKKALLAGKHVVTEKPFTLSVSEGDELIRLAREKNLILTVFQNRRWDGDFLTVRKIVSEGLLGRIVEFEAHFDRFRNYIKPGTWKEDKELGTGNIYNLGSHMIDQALILFGMPESVYADLRNNRDRSKVNDYYDIHLYYKRMKVILKSSYLVREPGPRYILHGTRGSFVKKGTDPQEEALNSGAVPGGEAWGQEEEEYWGILHTGSAEQPKREKVETLPGNYKAFYDNLFSAIREGKELSVKAREALDVIRIIEAAIISNRDKKMILL